MGMKVWLWMVECLPLYVGCAGCKLPKMGCRDGGMELQQRGCKTGLLSSSVARGCCDCCSTLFAAPSAAYRDVADYVEPILSMLNVYRAGQQGVCSFQQDCMPPWQLQGFSSPVCRSQTVGLLLPFLRFARCELGCMIVLMGSLALLFCCCRVLLLLQALSWHVIHFASGPGLQLLSESAHMPIYMFSVRHKCLQRPSGHKRAVFRSNGVICDVLQTVTTPGALESKQGPKLTQTT